MQNNNFSCKDNNLYYDEKNNSDSKLIDDQMLIHDIVQDNNIYFDNIGVTQKEYFELEKDLKINVKELYELNNKGQHQYNVLQLSPVYI